MVGDTVLVSFSDYRNNSFPDNTLEIRHFYPASYTTAPPCMPGEWGEVIPYTKYMCVCVCNVFLHPYCNAGREAKHNTSVLGPSLLSLPHLQNFRFERKAINEIRKKKKTKKKVFS
jgi:hypothetical protein